MSPIAIVSVYFNPLPRKEGDFEAFCVLCLVVISIHSLVKRETFCTIDSEPTQWISIHSLVKRETSVGKFS